VEAKAGNASGLNNMRVLRVSVPKEVQLRSDTGFGGSSQKAKTRKKRDLRSQPRRAGAERRAEVAEGTKPDSVANHRVADPADNIAVTLWLVLSSRRRKPVGGKSIAAVKR